MISKKEMIRLLAISVFFLSATIAHCQKAEGVSLEKLQRILLAKSGDLEIVNFWATWCAPCVKEIPLLEKINRERKDVKVTLVSLDFDLDPNPDRVNKFIERKNLQSRVMILQERDPNSWISKVDKSWSGALPATLIINHATGKRKFVERELHEGELEKWIDELK